VELSRNRSNSYPASTTSADFALTAGLLAEKLKVALRERMLICIVIFRSVCRSDNCASSLEVARHLFVSSGTRCACYKLP
jgi:hypothetical protein